MKHCKWSIQHVNKKIILVTRNCVTFRLPKHSCLITLIDAYYFFEVHIATMTTASVCQEMCPIIRKEILAGIEAASEKLHYLKDRPEVGVFCRCQGDPASLPQSARHAALVQGMGTDCASTCVETSVPNALDERSAIWFDQEMMPLLRTADGAAGSQSLLSEAIGLATPLEWECLGRIADSITEWEGPIADHLGLTEADVAEIKTKHPGRLKLQSREALYMWRERNGSKATYRKLIEIFERAGYISYADEVRRIAQHSDRETDSSSSGVATSGPEPQVHITADPADQLYGDKVTITADVMGPSAVSYQWLRNDEALSPANDPACEGVGTSALTIFPFTHDYEGKYQCSVSFSSGKVVKSSHTELTLGNVLSENDIQILNIVLAEQLANLEESGLSLTRDSHITKEEVVMHLQKTDQHDFAKILRNEGVQRLQVHVHDNVYKKALQDTEHVVNLQVFRMVLCGVPRSGKTTFWKRIAIKDFDTSVKSASTPAVDSHHCSISVTETKQQKSGQALQADEMLFDFHLCEDRDLDSEALTIYKLILERHEPQLKQQESQDATRKLQPREQSELQASKNITPVRERQASDKSLKADKSLQPATDSERNDNNLQSDNGQKHDSGNDIPSAPNQQKTPPSNSQIIIAINEHFQKLNDVLLKSKDLPDVLNIKKMCHLQDTGGQRAFLELLPTLSTGKALYLLFFNYKDFEKSVPEKMQPKGSPEELLTGIQYEQIDVIMQSLICVSTASEATVKNQSTEASTKSLDNMALLVGTHVDDKEVTPEVVERVDGIIKERMIPFRKNGTLVRTTSGDQILKVAIGSTHLCSNDPKDYVKVIMKIVDDGLKCKDSEELPASWYMFCVMLRRLQNDHSVLRYSHCEQIAEKLYIIKHEELSEPKPKPEIKQDDSALKSLLFRLQNVFGIVLYFPEVKGLEDVVVCDPAFIYKSISALIFDSFHGLHDEDQRTKLQKHGIFRYKELEKGCEIKQDLELSELILLLKHLGIIAPVRTQAAGSEYRDDSDNDQEYVIPCVLPEAKQQELLGVELGRTHACSIVPLRIYFNCGFAPMGGFCYLFTKLISNNEGWELCLPNQWKDENNIYWRNKVTFRVKLDSHNYLVTLLSTDKYYEIHIIHSVSEQPFQLQKDGHNICKHVWEAIHDVLEKSPNKSVQAYEVACICTMATNKHVMKFKWKPHENLPIEASCDECSCYPPLDKQASVMVWFKTPHIREKGKIGGKVQLCSLLFKIKDGRETPKCELWHDGKRISEDDSVEYDTDRKMFKLSIAQFESELKGKYECVVSTAEEPTVSTAVEIIIDSDSVEADNKEASADEFASTKAALAGRDGTVEYLTLILCTPELRNAVTKDLIPLSGYLVAEGLITPDNANDLGNEKNSESSRAATLVKLIQSQVQGGHQNYKKFINVLEKGGRKNYCDILRILESKRRSVRAVKEAEAHSKLTDDGATVTMRGDGDAMTGQLRDTVTDDTIHDHASDEGRKLTLEEVIAQAGIEKVDILDQECSQQVLPCLIKHCRRVNWQLIGFQLGLTADEINPVDDEDKTAEEKLAEILGKWKEKFSSKATYLAFVNALLSFRQAPVAINICKTIASMTIGLEVSADHKEQTMSDEEFIKWLTTRGICEKDRNTLTETLGITATILKELSSDDLKEIKKELTFGGRKQIEKLYEEIRLSMTLEVSAEQTMSDEEFMKWLTTRGICEKDRNTLTETLGITATIFKELRSDDLKELKKEQSLTLGTRLHIEKL